MKKYYQQLFVKVFNILLIVLIIGYGITACSQDYTVPTLTVLPIEETYLQAESVALNWRSDAQLNSAGFDIELGTYPSRMKSTYTFLSADYHQFLLVWVRTYQSPLSKTNQNGFYLDWSEGAWPEDRPIGTAIEIDEINLESNQALQAILEYGGNTYFERYRIRKKEPLTDSFHLNLRRLDRYYGEGPVNWTGGFSIDSPHAQLYISVEDQTGDLLKVKAYGEQEQEYWLREITVTEKISIGQSKSFFDIFDFRLDKITKENNRKYADYTIISPKTTWLIYGEVTHKHEEEDSHRYFGDYSITILDIDKDWIEIEVMPITRWYKPNPME